MLVFAFALALLIGLSLGLLGSGGSIITLPVLVYVAGIPAHQAVGMSLVIVGSTSTVGSLLHARRGSFHWPAAAFFAVSGMTGAFVGAKFTRLVPAPVLLLLFGVLMLTAGVRLLQKGESNPEPRPCRWWRCLGVGLAVGGLTGFLGVGGGFLILPALVLFAGLEMKPAIGTSLAVIAVNCFGGLAGQWRQADFDWRITLGFLAAAVAGMVIGTVLVGWVATDTLRRGFAGCVLLLGFALVARNGITLMYR